MIGTFPEKRSDGVSGYFSKVGFNYFRSYIVHIKLIIILAPELYG